MSGSEPMKTPCDQVIARLWEYIDGEMGGEPRTAGAIDAHLEACSHCFPQYDFQRAYVAFLRRTDCGQVPSGLRRRIFKMILEEEARTGVEGAGGCQAGMCTPDGGA